MIIVLIHFALAILLFYIINWIGKHSYSLGYVQISMFVRNEEAPALNFLIRVLSPIVYLIIVSTIFYTYKLDKFVVNIFLVNIYYLAFRLTFALVTGRGWLINWYRQALYWIAVIVISYETYDKFIRIKANILPDFTKMTEEVWIMILVFIFQVFNNIRVSNSNEVKRKADFLTHKYLTFHRKFGHIINQHISNEKLKAVAYAILIFEDFNRPKIIRLVENASLFIRRRPHTVGIMQVLSDRVLSDKESVSIGAKKLADAHASCKDKPALLPDQYPEYEILTAIIKDYNGGNSYQDAIYSLTYEIIDKFYKNTSDVLA